MAIGANDGCKYLHHKYVLGYPGFLNGGTSTIFHLTSSFLEFHYNTSGYLLEA
jgi:hypothetical protein